MTQTSISSNFY